MNTAGLMRALTLNGFKWGDGPEQRRDAVHVHYAFSGRVYIHDTLQVTRGTMAETDQIFTPDTAWAYLAKRFQLTDTDTKEESNGVHEGS